MNKSITVIELFNRMARNEELPEKIKYRNCEFRKIEGEGISPDYSNDDSDSILEYVNSEAVSLNEKVEILEDNTEEIEEIPQYRIDNCTDYNYCYLAEKYNKLAKAVNQIRKMISFQAVKYWKELER